MPASFHVVGLDLLEEFGIAGEEVGVGADCQRAHAADIFFDRPVVDLV